MSHSPSPIQPVEMGPSDFDAVADALAHHGLVLPADDSIVYAAWRAAAIAVAAEFEFGEVMRGEVRSTVRRRVGAALVAIQGGEWE